MQNKKYNLNNPSGKEVEHRLAMILDDIRAIKEFIEEKGLSDTFKQPSRQADECFIHFSNIEIACDLADNESTNWEKFYKS